MNQTLGEVVGKEPLQALKTIHSGQVAGYQRWEKMPFFGWNCISEDVGTEVTVGAEVSVLARKTTHKV